jgi:methylphosphotriester-DNA--protein-cysteine methyltransferase
LCDPVGNEVSPKAYQRVVRMQRFRRIAERGTGPAVASAEAGDADQSHLTRDVRGLSGTTPVSLLVERSAAAPMA